MTTPGDHPPLLAFYGDDFTGSTDALESLAGQGVRAVLFTDPPSAADLRHHPGLRAFGMAGQTRAMGPAEMERTLGPALATLRGCGPRFIHYKTCSTFDSSPAVGSIGRAIDVGIDVLGGGHVPVFVAAPDLGRYCAFGNLFARFGVAPEVYRLDRHPSMSRHPTTPMNEADLRLHLGRQTDRSIGLLDLHHLEMDEPRRRDRLRELRRAHPIVLIDGCNAAHLAIVGDVLHEFGRDDGPTFVVGSSGVESAMCARWRRDGTCSGRGHFDPVAGRGPILVVCGSCSPVTGQQIAHAGNAGFLELSFDGATDAERLLPTLVADAARALDSGRSVVLHSSGATRGFNAAGAPDVHPELQSSGRSIGRFLGTAAYRILERTAVGRVVIAGGDTSSEIARALKIRSVEMVGELTRGSPLCRATAPASPADGVEFTFKGGQIGPTDFFSRVERGLAATPA